MKQHRCWFTLGLWVVLVGSVLIAGRGVERSHRPLPSRSMSAQSAALSAGQRQAVQAALRQMPLYFVENRGQMDKRVAYYVQGRDTTVYFTSEGVTFALAQEASASPSSERLGDRAGTVGRVRSEKWGSKEGARRERWVVKKEFVGARSPARLRGEGMTEAVVSYFKGPRWQWHTGLRTYSRVVYEEVWEGIDLIYSGDGGRLKYTFVVKPGADVGQIRLRYRGVEGVSVNRDGELEVATPGGGFREAKPFSYQEKGGERVEV
ncbi:MAG: hypothetical protein RMK49_06870, partial [Abditibacteriales bacterium]|nr:hypothetical protein [Abditibacteriales bacterium]